MSNDLNLKKSWNPKLLKNREKVWKREQQLLADYKEEQQHKAGVEQQRERGELLSLRSKGLPSKSRTGWMYNSPKEAGDQNSDVLLGKKKISSNAIAPKKEASRFDKVVKTTAAVEKAPMSTDDTLDKNDPLYTIKLQEQKDKEKMAKLAKLKRLKEQSSRSSSSHPRHRERDRHHRSSKSHRDTHSRHKGQN